MTAQQDRDLLLLWLTENAERCRQRAREARRATRNPRGRFGASVTALADAHDAAAEVYEAAAAAAHRDGAEPEPAAPCRVYGDRVELALTNGCRLVSHGGEAGCVSGGDVHVLDAAGNEIGFWDAAEWRDDPELVMGAILNCAALGGGSSDTPDTERAPS